MESQGIFQIHPNYKIDSEVIDQTTPLSLLMLDVGVYSIVRHTHFKIRHNKLRGYVQIECAIVVQVNLDQINDLNTLSNRVATVAADSAKFFLALVPMLIVYPFAQKYFIHGIVQGSVKE